jgi:D-alanyl-D-alanine carboxypeptidase
VTFAFFKSAQKIMTKPRRWCILLCATAILFMRIAAASADVDYAGPNLVFDSRTGDVLYSARAGDKWYPASLTKMMTAYVVFKALKSGRISLKTRLKVSKKASRQPPSKIGLRAGTRISVNKALEALIVRSGNDIAMVLAEGVGKTEANFVRKMNAAARKLGMSATTYGNPHGLTNRRQITTARDMGILAQALITNFPQYRRYFKMKTVRVGKKTLKTRNKLLKTLNGADGMKTGFICTSGFNIVVSATRGGRRLVVVVMGSKSAKLRNARAAQLLDWAFTYQNVTGNATGATKLARLSNGALKSRPTNMRSIVCKKKKRRANKRRKKNKHRAKGS